MEIRKTFEKKLCMSELRLTHARYEREHHCDSGNGADTSRIVLAVSGHADIRTPNMNLQIDSSDCGLFYIPEGAGYHIIWSGTPEIEYYIFGIVSRGYDSDNADRFGIQKILLPDTENARKILLETASLIENSERTAVTRAFGLFYLLYSDVLNTLKEADNPRYNRTLSAAMEYIEKHYGENFSMETLSAAMCLSESRLYHLFREELNTTPVKYRCSVRVRHAADDLRLGIYTTEETAFRNGFRSTAYFREAFRNEMGISVSEYRRMLREDRQKI